MTWKGPWSSATTYATHDAVSFNGSSYFAINGSTNDQPPSANWGLLSSGLPSGTIIFIVDGTPVPAGYTLVGTFSQPVKSSGNGKNNVNTTFDVYQKN